MEYVNILGSVIASIAMFVLGWIWYSNKVFGQTWRKHSGLATELHDQMAKDKKVMARAMIGYFVSLLVLAGFISWLLGALLVFTFAEAAQLMLCVWVGIVIPATIGSMLWERKSLTYYAVNVGYTLAAMILAAGVLVGLG